MRLDRFFTDPRRVIERILEAFDHNITVQENFGPSGVPEDYIIISRGPTLPPIWAPISSLPEGEVETPVGIPGPPGSPGAPGQDANPADVLAQLDKIVTSEGNVVVSGGNVVYSSGS